MSTDPNKAQSEDPPSTIINDYKALLESAWETRTVAEKRATQARDEVFRVATCLCAAALDAKRREVREWDMKGLADFVIDQVGRQVDEVPWLRMKLAEIESELEKKKTEFQRQVAAWQRESDSRNMELTQARAELEQLKRVNTSYEEQIAQLLKQAQNQARQVAELSAPQPVSAEAPGTEDSELSALCHPSTDSEQWPDWLQKWSATAMYARDVELLRLIGLSVECRREELLALFAKQTRERERGSGAEKKIVTRLIEMNLVKAMPVKLYRGNPPELLALSPRGLEAYRLIYGGEPRQSYIDYSALHKSDDQIYLALQSIDFLESAGYIVERFPTMTILPDGAKFVPDLIASRGRERLYAEVETGAYSNDMERERKWRVMAAGTQGQINIITHNRASMTKLSGEVQNIRYPQPVALRLTNLEEAAALPPEKSFWLIERTIR